MRLFSSSKRSARVMLLKRICSFCEGEREGAPLVEPPLPIHVEPRVVAIEGAAMLLLVLLTSVELELVIEVAEPLG